VSTGSILCLILSHYRLNSQPNWVNLRSRRTAHTAVVL